MDLPTPQNFSMTFQPLVNLLDCKNIMCFLFQKNSVSNDNFSKYNFNYFSSGRHKIRNATNWMKKVILLLFINDMID